MRKFLFTVMLTAVLAGFGMAGSHTAHITASSGDVTTSDNGPCCK